MTKYCDAIREELEKRDLTKYVNSVLTAYVVKKPADYEASLSLLHRLKGQLGESSCFTTLNLRHSTIIDIDQDLVEEAVKYIIFLVDADRLFNTALGMYDFSLVLLIAQHSQKVCDPSYMFHTSAHSRY